MLNAYYIIIYVSDLFVGQKNNKNYNFYRRIGAHDDYWTLDYFTNRIYYINCVLKNINLGPVCKSIF